MHLKNFGTIFSESFSDYKKHFVLFTKVSFLLYFLPTVILSLLYMNTTKPLDVLVYGAGVQVISGLFSVLLTFTIIKVLLLKRQNKEIGVRDALKHGTEHYFTGVMLAIITNMALFGLYLLFIIPGIIFSVYWEFAYFALITDNVGVTKALSHSKKVVEGRWWTVLGYLILFGLIIVALNFGTISIYALVSFIFSMYMKNTFLHESLRIILMSLFEMLIIPFSMVFSEKMYLRLKETTKKLD
ncbi:MAG: hypothetical protein V1859_05935 [archaeon]